MLRIANAAGFWGDRNDVLVDQVRGGPIDVVMLDYLAEVTMAILHKARRRDPTAGYARDFVRALEPALDDIVDRGISVVTNAGGMNPMGCAEAVAALARSHGRTGVRIGVVTGDDIFGRIDELAAAGVSMAHIDTGAAFEEVRDRAVSANAYLGAAPIAEALRDGAQIVITGRCTDSALALGPLLARYDWADDDWDRRAAGIVAGHIIECGGQASGGNFAGGWDGVPNLARLGYPIAEVDAGGEMTVTKHPGLGGCVTPAVVTEQLVYEIGDPRAYVTPDVVADFTTLVLDDLGDDRVRVTGATGRPAPSELKVSITYEDGWRNTANLTFVWPRAVERANAAAELLLARCRHLGLEIDAHRVDLIGASGAHGHMAPPPTGDEPEVLLRVAIRTRDRESARRFGAEVSPLLISGIPGACPGIRRGRPAPMPIVNHWAALVPRDCVHPSVEVIES